MINGNRILAWCVHAYTALGLVVAALMAVLIVQGGEEQLQTVLLLVLVSLAIDSTDGWFARKLGVAHHVPEIDGRRLDDIIDFHTYTSLPLLLIWRSGLLSAGTAWVLLVPLVASIFGFSHADAKTEDHYFLGFPSYWNVIALYAVLLQPAPPVLLGAVLLFSALTFIPSKYLHTSHPGRLSLPTNVAGVLWGLLMIAILTGPLQTEGWILVSLAFPLYYLVASWVVTLGEWRQGRRTVGG